MLPLLLHIPYKYLDEKRISIFITQMNFRFKIDNSLTVVLRDASENIAQGAAKIAPEKMSNDHH